MPDYTVTQLQERLEELEYEVKDCRKSCLYLEMDRDKWKAAAVAFEKERDEALFDLAFRRDLFKLQENQLDEMRKQLAEAVSSCHIWQSGHSELVDDRNRWVSLASVRREEYLQAATLVNDLNKELAILRKQNTKQLTILQEHGLAEYGN